jgi:hypothetical protein
LRRIALSFALAAVSLTPALANFTYVESVDGDFSNDRLNTTDLLAGLGVNSITGTSSTPGPGQRDFDYFTVTVPAGHVLTSLVLKDYFGEDLSFLGMMAGSQFTVDPTSPGATIPPQLLGWVHMTPPLIGQNLLPTMAGQTMPAPVMGFTMPLPAGDYSFWVQEASGTVATYSLDFNVAQIPEPSSLALTGIASALSAWLARRRKAA